MLFTQEIRNCAGRDVGLMVWCAKVHMAFHHVVVWASVDRMFRDNGCVMS